MTTLIRSCNQLLEKMKERREIPNQDEANIRYFVEKQKTHKSMPPEEVALLKEWLLAISTEDKMDVWSYILNLEHDEILRLPNIALKKMNLS
jgi:hypothetical protein